MTVHLTRALAVITRRLRARVAAARAQPDAGSHATEFAIGVGLSAAIALALWAAYQTGISTVVSSWFFGGN